ncbi:MAG: hypothetical protein A3G25_18275 [Betaproteobacteria bacterium RIFCSPLOWO2_12_FULL_63_13]|nr:MAG: hypothetical protein A3H32_17245 [Betaproteobacteria bacterium RIFCSPLOWO2_02_FULL_63_19]OGA50055.1 MAG: hypothetical protein A3G25_18275 [Betaproteobacteria bacterium RIFCSPLOWO2_12_FULL_63_13]
MENIWGATQFALIVYGIGAVVSFLVAWIITLTFAAIRMHNRRNAAPDESKPKGSPESAPAGPKKAA